MSGKGRCDRGAMENRWSETDFGWRATRSATNAPRDATNAPRGATNATRVQRRCNRGATKVQRRCNRGATVLQGHPLRGHHQTMVHPRRRRTRTGRAQHEAAPPGLPPAPHHGQRRGALAENHAALRPRGGGDEGADTQCLHGRVVRNAADDAGSGWK